MLSSESLAPSDMHRLNQAFVNTLFPPGNLPRLHIAALSPWRAGSAGFLPPADKDEEHGSFIAGLLVGAGTLNPELAERFERVPCRFYDIDLFPRRGLLNRYYRTPEDFFDQLDEQVARAKSDYDIRVFNMSLGAQGMREGLSYSSFAAQVDRIAKEHNVIFIVSAGNLRGAVTGANCRALVRLERE